MSDVMMNVHTCVTDDTTYIMLYVKSLSVVMMNVYTCVTNNATYIMLYVRSLYPM